MPILDMKAWFPNSMLIFGLNTRLSLVLSLCLCTLENPAILADIVVLASGYKNAYVGVGAWRRPCTISAAKVCNLLKSCNNMEVLLFELHIQGESCLPLSEFVVVYPSPIMCPECLLPKI